MFILILTSLTGERCGPMASCSGTGPGWILYSGNLGLGSMNSNYELSPLIIQKHFMSVKCLCKLPNSFTCGYCYVHLFLFLFNIGHAHFSFMLINLSAHAH